MEPNPAEPQQQEVCAKAASAETRATPTKLGRLMSSKVGISLESTRWASKLAKLDVNQDGVIDAAEVAQMVDELVKEQSLRQVYRFMAIALLVVVAVLIGALTGIIWAVVELSKETKVTKVGAPYQYMTTTTGETTVVGGPIIELSGRLPSPYPSSVRIAFNSTAPNGRRRLLDMDKKNLVLYDVIEFAEDEQSVMEQCCTWVARGTHSGQVSVPGTLKLAGGNRFLTLTLQEHSGCPPNDRNATEAMGIVKSESGVSWLIICPLLPPPNKTCEIWFDRSTVPARRSLAQGADIIVDGIVASPHSDWLLDAVAPAWMVPYLPYVYEAFLAPVYGLYCVVGPSTAEWLAHGLRLAENGSANEYGMGYFAVLAGMAAALLATSAMLSSAASKRRRLALF
ncbi:hypothetical protein GPECTOR_523g510 [Gonium pectorale]|uniref:EF-hand domain-containing protein n=1 Tax=Gonium pectorale TaxID=33097 RepID=A0A150FUV2_GONPE|nr:hypothetical protein GPECTOR_523g510 [Gonium pectorale]|eukprot:KXZ41358.1 hypothetical protein GPECTOR_523g510 [Gonium pectorale]